MCKSSYRKSIEHVFYKKKIWLPDFQKGHRDKCPCHRKVLAAAKVEEIKEKTITMLMSFEDGRQLRHCVASFKMQ